MADEICWLDATELAARIRAKELSPLEVTRAHLERIARLNPSLNAVVTLALDPEARARAAESALMRGGPLGPLHGVPFTVKDSFETAGLRTTCGSRLLADHVPTADATVVTRCLDAGGIMLGKTNTPEFTLWAETSNLVLGRTVNPWNADRTSGGSSGGEAAAIAAGLSPLGVGSDVGGSIRVPAHYCGIVGLKPTHGRVPLTGHLPATLTRFLHAGPMARTVRDVALGLQVLAGPDGRDWSASPMPAFVATDPPPAGQLRVGWMAERGFSVVHPEVVNAVTRAADSLRAAGAVVEPVSIPGLEQHDWNALSIILFGAEAGPYFDALIAGRHEQLHPLLRRRLGARIDALADYIRVENEVDALRRDLMDHFRRHDILLCPTGTLLAHPHDATEHVIAGQTVPARHALRATVPFDLTGSPALSVPFGVSSDGLPIGVQLVGRACEEGRVLQVGALLEAASQLRERPPVG